MTVVIAFLSGHVKHHFNRPRDKKVYRRRHVTQFVCKNYAKLQSSDLRVRTGKRFSFYGKYYRSTPRDQHLRSFHLLLLFDLGASVCFVTLRRASSFILFHGSYAIKNLFGSFWTVPGMRKSFADYKRLFILFHFNDRLQHLNHMLAR